MPSVSWFFTICYDCFFSQLLDHILAIDDSASDPRDFALISGKPMKCITFSDFQTKGVPGALAPEAPVNAPTNIAAKTRPHTFLASSGN
jgi:hypothetical protein